MSAEQHASEAIAAENGAKGSTVNSAGGTADADSPCTPWQEDVWPESAGWQEAGGWADHSLLAPLLGDVHGEEIFHEVAPSGTAADPNLAGADAGSADPNLAEADAGSEDPNLAEADADSWTSIVVFGDRPDSPLLGSMGLPATESLSAAEALAVAECAERVIGWATGIRLRALARLEPALAAEGLPRRDSQPVRFGGDEVHALAVAEAATTAAVSEAAAARLLQDAADLTETQSHVLEAVQTGTISFQHARVILDQARTLPPEAAEAFGQEALERAVTRSGRRRTPAELRSALRRLRERMHPETIQSRKKAAARDRGIWFAPEPDGMCTLTALLPAEVGLAVFNGLDTDARTALAAARRAPGRNSDEGTPDAPAAAAEERTLSQLRVDALIHRLLGVPDPAFAGSFRPEVVVTIPIGLALSVESGPSTPVQGPIDNAPAAPIDNVALGSIDPFVGPFARVMGAAVNPNGHERDPARKLTAPLPSMAQSVPLPAAANAAPLLTMAQNAPRPAMAQPEGPAQAQGVAQLEGYGPIDAATARRLASLAPNWDRLFTDALTGAALGVGRTAYRPPKALRRYLAHRDGGCMFPGCTRRAKLCEPDHTIEWQDGGRTDPDNLTLLCRRHHAFKSIGAWRYRHDPREEGSLLRWTSPLGRTYISETAVTETAAQERALPTAPTPSEPQNESPPF
ncbi:HNH endonuclease [Sinomonas humi]|uniref:HNH endonuclease n=1 Tax=Sinomonas humi TaxID=1338436 RepID=UPI00068B494F|nr:HNH endonuclease signature motif containing protein [Sinomonas humi]